MSHNPFLGTWQLRSGEFGEHGQPVTAYDMTRLASRKVISQQGFSFLTLQDGKFYSAASGSYRFDDADYVETPAMTTWPVPEGQQYTFRYEFIDGLWHNKRSENGVQVEHEIWEKVAD
ncbi:hypothetical protein [Chitinilyticum litopenaei]|uniref:hypothetical protein n=1 Tax=Chitinilyticum litopenaei TaxID=1121276 RepID=UPI0004110C8C|nr:hypothetical protein [Chitinilyticum litopenaei]